MLPNHLMNQEITIYPLTSYDREGREVHGTSYTARARIQSTTKQRLLPNGTIVNVLATVYVPRDTVVDIDYKILWNNTYYKVFGRYAPPGRDGNANHIKLELIRWLSSS